MAKLKLAVVADPHYYAQSLGISGSAYERRESACQTFLKESDAIIARAFDIIAASDADAVLIAGDVSHNGELESHEGVLRLIEKLSEKKPVYTVYATHDFCCDGHPKRYVGASIQTDVKTATPPSLREMYKKYGPENAISEHVNANGSSSYVAKLADGYRLFGVNDDGGIAEDAFEWLDEQAKAAKAAGDEIIVMQHHLIMNGISRLINRGQSIRNAAEAVKKYSEYGVKTVFVGHSHMKRVSESGGVTQINLGALTGFPCEICYATFDGGKCSLSFEKFEFEYDGKKYTRKEIGEKACALIDMIAKSTLSGKDAFLDALDRAGIHLKTLPVPESLVSMFGGKLCKGSAEDFGKFLNHFPGVKISKQTLRDIGNMTALQIADRFFMCVLDEDFTLSAAEKNLTAELSESVDKLLKYLPVPEKYKSYGGEVRAILAKLAANGHTKTTI